MNESEEKLSRAEQKKQIRERYRGVDMDKLDVIPALPEEDLYDDTKHKRVAVYARVSTDDPRQTSSYELQKNHYTDVVARHQGWELVRIYADEGISGTSLQHRDEFLRMIDDCKAGKIDLIVTKSVSRFARNVYDCIGYVRELKALEPPIGILFETEQIYTLNAQSEMSLSFIATLAQEESHTKSEIMNSSIEMRFRRGLFLTPVLLGFDHDEEGNLVINEDEAKTVRLAFFMFLYGYTTSQIAELLTQLQRRTKKGNVTWSASTIYSMLSNERYCGDILARKTYTPNYLDHKSKKNNQKRTQYRQRDHHEAIVSRDDFMAVQQILQNARYGGGFLPQLQVVDKGALKGFVVLHPTWAGFTVEDYINACETTYTGDEYEQKENIVVAKQGDYDLRGFEVVRTQFIDTYEKPFMTFSPSGITFSAFAIKKFEKIEQIELLVEPNKLQMAVRPGAKDSKYSMKWSRQVEKGIISRTIAGKAFLSTIYKMFEWDPENRYRITGTYHETKSGPIITFDMTETEIFIPIENLPEERAEIVKEMLGATRRNIKAFPEAWINDFGSDVYFQAQGESFSPLERKSWDTQRTGTDYHKDESLKNLDITKPDELASGIREIISEIKGDVENG